MHAADGCCDTAAHLTSTAAAADADAADPALDECCARDLRQQAASARLDAALAAVDRVGAAARARGEVVGVGPAASDDDDDDRGLAELRAARLVELKRAAAAIADARPPGVFDVAPSGLAAALEAAPETAALHLATPGLACCDALDELLTTLANEHRAGAFLRCAPRSARSLPRGLPPPPALCAFRDGTLVASTSVLLLCGADGALAEERAAAWLRRAGGLAGGADAASSSDSGSDGDACDVCGRTYPHSHVQAVRGAGWGGDDDCVSD